MKIEKREYYLKKYFPFRAGLGKVSRWNLRKKIINITIKKIKKCDNYILQRRLMKWKGTKKEFPIDD